MLAAKDTPTASLDAASAVSVIICAYTLERWQDVCIAVKSTRRELRSIDELIVVVDHNSELLSRLSARFPDVRIVENLGEKGLSGARNSGVAAARGGFIAFLDDDAMPMPGCFAALLSAVQADNVLGVSCRVVPDWETGRPVWFPDEFLWVVGCNDPGLRAGPVRNLIGACMILKRSVFDAIGGFNATLGRSRSGLPMGGEETELCIRAAAVIANGQFQLVRTAEVRHKVHAARTSARYFFRRCFAEGLSKAALSKLTGSARGLSAERTAVLQTLPLAVMQGIHDGILRRDPSGFARAAAIVAGLACTVAGYLIGKLPIAAAWSKAATQTDLRQYSQERY